MKRFLLFAGRRYYPAGGMKDLIGDYDTEQAARAKAEKGEWFAGAYYSDYDWWQILDTENAEAILHPSPVELDLS